MKKILFSLLILALIVGGFYYFGYVNSNDSDSNDRTNSGLNDSNWSSYSSSAYDFKISHPKNWYYLEGNNLILFDPEAIPSIIPNSEPPITITSISFGNRQNINTRIQNLRNVHDLQNFSETTVAIDGIDARRISGLATGESYVRGKYYDAVIFLNNGQLVSLTYTSDTLENLEVFNEMLSSFEFTN